ncbi:uncharacterized protein LOC133802620 isoform X2 [Humulus lupulus]|uniref:uncharacterized protein LOC133802620 isoform X2 n=1 Tax=Humulus lupulus TaxID=3486 RepID=UPI002B400683|nr:uncharacterized protein LOC133802620 isoform X2 [Humulus lupulus]
MERSSTSPNRLISPQPLLLLHQNRFPHFTHLSFYHVICCIFCGDLFKRLRGLLQSRGETERETNEEHLVSKKAKEMRECSWEFGTRTVLRKNRFILNWGEEETTKNQPQKEHFVSRNTYQGVGNDSL